MQSIKNPFENLKFATLQVVSAHPEGIRQSEVAKALGIPSAFDKNWITKHLLDGLVAQGMLIKNERKLFTAV